MEAGGAAGGGGAIAAVGVGGAAAAAGAATGVIRAVARVHLVLVLAAAAFALCVVTLQPQLKQQGSDCAATEADAVTMRTHGLLLLLSAGSQASVAAFAPEFWNHRFICWIFTAFAHALSVVTYFHLITVFDSVAAVAVGSCPGHLHAHRTEYIALGVLLSLPHRAFSLVGVVALVAPIVAPSL